MKVIYFTLLFLLICSCEKDRCYTIEGKEISPALFVDPTIVGAGLKFALSDTWNLGVEGGFRRAFTDYLDDVSMSYVEESLLLEKNPLSAALANRSGNPIAAGSARGNDKVSDWYAFFGVTLSKNFLDNGLVGSRKRGRKSKTGCPTF